MIVRFVTPSAAKQIGGIQNAVAGLRSALERESITVLEGGAPGAQDSIHHFHGLWEPWHSRLAARLRRAKSPYVVSPHGMLEPWALRHRRWKKLPYFWLIERRFLKGAKSIFVTSTMEALNLERVLHHPCVEILPLGCRDRRGPGYSAARRSLEWSPDERVMLFLSRIDVKKGLDLLLQAMAGGGQEWKGWRLVVVGDGEARYVRSLKATAVAAAQQLPEVEWVGPVWGSARWPYFQAADLFCLPTHSENFGIAVLEALHVGTPVMTTDQTPWREYGDRDGIFIAKPTISSLRETLGRAVARVTGKWSCADRTGLAAWAASGFAWESLTTRYIQAYRRAYENG